MKRYSTDYIVSDGRNPRFWQPSSFWGWLWRTFAFLIFLLVFIILFCLKCTREEPNQESTPDTPVLHEGDVEITLEWETSDDLDLHCIDPRRDEIYYSNRRGRSGGYLDCDMNVRGGVNGVKAIEHIYWPLGGAAKGNYKVSVVFFKRFSNVSPVPFTVKVKTVGNTVPIDTVIHKTIINRGERVNVIDFNVSFR